MSARFRPESSSSPRAVKFRSDPPSGMLARDYYARMLLALPKTVGAVLSLNVLRAVRQELDDYEAVGEWLADVVKRRNAPVMVNIGDRTVALGPGTYEALLGHCGVMAEYLEQEFGPIARIGRPGAAA